MALPKAMRLKGHRTFDYIHKNSVKYYGKLMTFKIARSNPEILISHKNVDSLDTVKIAITKIKKESKKAKKLRKKLERAKNEVEENFKVDLDDNRFSAVFQNADFNRKKWNRTTISVVLPVAKAEM